jgi:hypothetical protein
MPTQKKWQAAGAIEKYRVGNSKREGLNHPWLRIQSSIGCRSYDQPDSQSMTGSVMTFCERECKVKYVINGNRLGRLGWIMVSMWNGSGWVGLWCQLHTVIKIHLVK